jgi:hypothetical protein
MLCRDEKSFRMNVLDVAKGILQKMDGIEYGFVDKNSGVHKPSNDDFDEAYWRDYFLQSPTELQKTKVGLCWDDVELERDYFIEAEIKVKTFFIAYRSEKELAHVDLDYPTHTFVVFEDENKVFWFEYSWSPWTGIHEYTSLQDLLSDISSKFIELNGGVVKSEDNVPENLVVFEYEKPKYGIGAKEYHQYCEKGINVEL